MADVNRNEEKVPAPEEIHGLAAALDQFVEDFDPYEYMDTVEDKAQNIRDTEAMLLAGKTDGLKSYLLGFIDDGRDPQAVLAAQELMKRLEEIAPQNILRTAEMSMEQNCNMIDGILNNLQNPEEAGFSIDGGSRYLAIQTCDNGYDYTFFNQDFQELDGGQLDNPEFSMSRAIYELLSDERLQETKLEALDYAFLMEQAEAAEKEKRAAALAALAMQEQKQETPLLRVVPVNRFERYIEPSEINLEKDTRVNLLMDIQARLQGRGPGMERWMKIHNLKEAAKTLNYLTEHGISEYDVLASKAETSAADFEAVSTSIKQMEHRMEQIAALKTHIINYAKTRNIYLAYRKTKVADKPAFRAAHETELLLHEAAKRAFDAQGVKKLPTVKALQAEYNIN